MAYDPQSKYPIIRRGGSWSCALLGTAGKEILLEEATHTSYIITSVYTFSLVYFL